MNGNNRRTFNNNQHSSGSGKNPYELRTELLSLAYTICYNQHVADEVQAQLSHNETADVSGTPRTAPTTDQVIECANQLNDFISQKTAGSDY